MSDNLKKKLVILTKNILAVGDKKLEVSPELESNIKQDFVTLLLSDDFDENDMIVKSIIRLFFHKKLWPDKLEWSGILEKFFGAKHTRDNLTPPEYFAATRKIILENFNIDIPDPEIKFKDKSKTVIKRMKKKKSAKKKIKVRRIKTEEKVA